MQKYTVKVFNDRTEWYNSEDNLHREDGPAVEWASGTKFWYKNGLFHREGGPAIEYKDGTKFWYKNGKYHREDGPAVELANGTKEWWLDGNHLTKKEWQRQLDKFSCDGKIVEIEGKKYQLKEI